MAKQMVNLAKNNRRNPTEAEKILWRNLCRKQVSGLKFRRQEPIGKFIVDFVCFPKKLIIEIDGGQHAVEIEKDLEREGWLRSQGFRLLRFWNNEVLGNLEGVLEVIRRELQSPSPFPLPSREGVIMP